MLFLFFFLLRFGLCGAFFGVPSSSALRSSSTIFHLFHVDRFEPHERQLVHGNVGKYNLRREEDDDGLKVIVPSSTFFVEAASSDFDDDEEAKTED